MDFIDLPNPKNKSIKLQVSSIKLQINFGPITQKKAMSMLGFDLTSLGITAFEYRRLDRGTKSNIR